MGKSLLKTQENYGDSRYQEMDNVVNLPGRYIAGDKDYITRSHERCREYGVEFERVYSSRILDEKELFNKLETNRELILTAAPFMNQLYDFVKGSNFFTILTDREGCILNVIGDEDILGLAFSIKMVPGAYMDEKGIGTNAMGTCLVEEKPLQVSGNEHYIDIYHRWTCSASPILDPDGNIIGTIDLTGYSELVHSHTLGMVVAAANSISKMMEVFKFESELVTRKNYYESVLDALLLGVIITDLDDRIITVNTFSSEMFGYAKTSLRQMSVSDIIKDWHRIRYVVVNDGATFEEDVDIYARKNRQQFNLVAHPIKDGRGNVTNIVLSFKEVKKQRKLADKLMGRHAIYTFDKIVGRDENFMKIVDFAKKVADSRSNILIMGDSGTGKELFAQSIHNYSQRDKEPFIALNCGAIPRNLIESELFGYEEGAFTGAKTKGQPGKFEIADGGTIFLDEIGEMPLDLQTRLLRVIEEGTVSRIGSIQEKVVNVRVISATNKDLKEEVEMGTFRKDLYYRLNVLPLRLPSLRERRSDIPLLVGYFMERVSKKLNKKSLSFTEEEMDRLIGYDWPGNIRELENFIELCVNTETVPDIFEISSGSASKKHYEEELLAKEKEFRICSLEDIEKEHILRVLAFKEGNISHAAQVLGIGRNTLYRKIEAFKS